MTGQSSFLYIPGDNILSVWENRDLTTLFVLLCRHIQLFPSLDIICSVWVCGWNFKINMLQNKSTGFFKWQKVSADIELAAHLILDHIFLFCRNIIHYRATTVLHVRSSGRRNCAARLLTLSTIWGGNLTHRCPPTVEFLVSWRHF